MISICIATHNGSKFIKQQIISILNQLSDDDEIIVSDDGSTDDTLTIIESIMDNRIKVFHYVSNNRFKSRHKSFYLATSNFFNSLSKSKGEYIFLCDQDDIWSSEKVKICLKYLLHFDYVKHDCTLIDKNGKLIKESLYDESKYENLSFCKSFKDLPFRGCCMAFRRDVIISAMPFPRKCFQHDSWLGMTAILNGFRFKYINEPLIEHRIHEDNVSSMKSPNSLGFRILYRLILLRDLIRWRFMKIHSQSNK